MIQFPWRYLTIATILCTFVTVVAVGILFDCNKQKEASLSIAVMLFTTLINIGLLYMEYTNVSIVTQMYAAQSPLESITNIYGGEYLLADTDTTACTQRAVAVSSSTVEFDSFSCNGGVSTINCSNYGSQQEYVEIPVFNYPHYHAFVTETGEELKLQTGTNNCIRIIIPVEFDGTIQIKYVIPIWWYIASGISMLTCIGMFSWYLYKKRQESKE